MSSRLRSVVVGGAFASCLLLARGSVAQLVTFQSPHSVRAPAAILDDELTRAVDAKIATAKLGSVDELLHFALGVTGGDLRFGLEHKTTLKFGTKEREGNCIEYAHLFATVFNRAADRKHVAARAYVVHSDARVLGKRLSTPGLDDHDWVLFVPALAASSPPVNELGKDDNNAKITDPNIFLYGDLGTYPEWDSGCL